MTIAEHLREARRRLLRIAIGLAVGVLAGYLLSEQVIELLRAPIEVLAATRDASLNFDSVSAAFDLRVRIALFAGVVLSSPVWLFQVFAYVVPALSRRERRYTVAFLAAAVPLFAAGCAAGLLMFPHVVELLAGFAPEEDSSVLVASSYFDFVMKLVLAVGVAFVLPVFVVLMNLMGVLPGARVVASWRIVILAIVLFSALATPAADVVSMFLLAVPMTLLFGAAAVVAVLHDRAVARRPPAAQLAETTERDRRVPLPA